MALGDITSGLNELIVSLPVEVSDKVLDLVLVLQALGIAAILYVAYAITMGVFTYRRMKQVEVIEKKADVISNKVNSIDKKLDKLLKEKKI